MCMRVCACVGYLGLSPDMYQVKCFFLRLNYIPRPLWDFQAIILFLLEQNNDNMFFLYLLGGYRKAIILINI